MQWMGFQALHQPETLWHVKNEMWLLIGTQAARGICERARTTLIILFIVRLPGAPGATER